MGTLAESGISLLLPIELVQELVAAEIRDQVARKVAALPPPDPLYTLAEVAALVSVHPETVSDWTKLEPGKCRYLRCVNVSASAQGRRVLHSVLAAWCEGNSSQPVPDPPARVRARAMSRAATYLKS